jgi:hypothetical protein
MTQGKCYRSNAVAMQNKIIRKFFQAYNKMENAHNGKSSVSELNQLNIPSWSITSFLFITGTSYQH